MPRGLGSVRELQNFVECAVILAQGSELYVPVVELMDTKKVSSGVYGFCAALT